MEYIQLMKYFNEVIGQLIEMHKDTNTLYSPAKMFHSSMELSFAISRLIDTEKVLTSETLDNEELTPDLRTKWFTIRDTMPQNVAQNIAICIINNTPLNKTGEEIDSIKHLFFNEMNDFTDNEELSKAFTDIFFSNVVKQDISREKFKK